MVTGIVDVMLKSMNVWNMIADSDESENSEEDIKFDVNWIHRIILSSHKRSVNLDESLQLQKKRKRHWKYCIEISDSYEYLGRESPQKIRIFNSDHEILIAFGSAPVWGKLKW